MISYLIVPYFQTKTRSVCSDIGSFFKGIVGGELTGLSELTRDTRNELMNEAMEKATELGANALCGVRFETNTLMEGSLDIVMYGTAIVYKRK